jgi:hypothetical protein
MRREHCRISLSPEPRRSDADVIVSLDADPLGAGPLQIVHARGFAARRPLCPRLLWGRRRRHAAAIFCTGSRFEGRLVISCPGRPALLLISFRQPGGAPQAFAVRAAFSTFQWRGPLRSYERVCHPKVIKISRAA